jgi:predicted nucleotidyltransferase
MIERVVPERYPGEFLRVVIGSTIHGLSVAQTDDLDLLGICIEPPSEVLGLGKPFEQHVWRTQPEGHPSGPGDVDLTTFSLRKYLYLAAQGNPTVINLLFVPQAYRYLDGWLGDRLREKIPMIVSKEAGARYLGYAKSQRERLLGLRGQKHTGYTRRLKYEAQDTPDGIPYDSKYGMHLCRLAVQGIELLTTGRITFPVPEPERTKLMDIRAGCWTLDEVVAWSNRLEEQLIVARHESPLPDHPDREALSEWMVQTYLQEWESPHSAKGKPL